MASRGGEDAAIADIAADDKPVAPTLYQAYSSNLRKAVDAVFADGRNAGTADRLRANVSRFAAYKAWHATAQVREALDENGGDMEAARRTLRRFNRWQAAEYNTAVARSRTAKQWQQWNDGGDNSRVFPNIVWLPSMSATPREEHRAFWNRVWPKDDPFWDTNQPGNLWNCKCDWEQTDEPVTGDNPEGLKPARGLEGNPAETGQIFTDECTYFKNISNTKRKKMEKYVGEKILKKESIHALKAVQNDKVTVDKRGVNIDVLFDSKTTSHLANDVAENCNFLWNVSMPRIKELLENATLVAHERNVKLVKKPSAVHYYYYECRIGKEVFYLNVEENYVVMEGRHFYRLYSIVDKLRDTAILY